MTLIVKIMSDENLPDTDPSKRFSLYAGVKSFHPIVQEPEVAGGKPYCYLRLYIADPVKTAAVPGFVEHETCVDVDGNVYVMNEAGKTIATWTPPCGAPN
ncbi:hypothetical protein HOT99_gp290 [Caulobacter phage CcrBL10]|uniref:Uncharacterized protein n=1 Tax=Caulobacter phage CcrBL10 TaxID=2283269 RepID=A0A385EBZ0_9CAUD|nr:hypothetical protein HOT99_gp290 [Caulobacter phage CcrBL10]AXQ68327.1 hypothetical protein CcrBL10_gp123 [Caulobacter phage CcrBL10]